MSHNLDMNVGRESDGRVLPAKGPNKGGSLSPAEGLEGRRPTKENTEQAAASRMQSWGNALAGLHRVREAAKREKQLRFTALLHHVSVTLLANSFYALKRGAAPGVDGLTWQEYETDLDKRLEDLHSRVHRGTYRALPSKRAYIPKPDGRQRPLGIAALEDKIVQHAVGTVLVIRYADDSVLGFPYRADAERFLREWRERLQKFGLELHPDKTRLIEFGRFAAKDRKRRGEGKPETFNFLGFTHICGQSWKNGKFFVLRKTIRERLLAKLKQVKAVLWVRMHQPLAEVGRWLRSVVQGYFNYHAVPGNFASLWSFRFEVRKRWLHVIRRRSQKSGMTWELLEGFATQWLPVPKILHPYPLVRFDAKHLR
jgi:Reverse transcriptase (RNA-dependent DNA polymerase)